MAAAGRRLPAVLDVPWRGRDLIAFVVAWLGIQAVIVLLLGAVRGVVPPVQQFLTAAQQGEVAATLGLDLLNAGVGFGLVWLYLRHYRVGWTAVGWRRVSVVRALAYLVAILVLFVVTANVILWAVSVLVPAFDANQPQQNEFTGMVGTHRNAALVALVLLPPVLEETIFRGFLFPALAKKWGVLAGAIVSSALFAVAHGQANIAVYTFPLGLLLCFMYVRLGSIFPGIALHMLNNYLAFLALASSK